MTGPIQSAVAIMLVLVGLFFTFVSTTGVLRLPDIYSRAHTASQADTLGAGFTLAGVALAIGLNGLSDSAAGLFGFDLPTFPLAGAVALAFGAMLGDILASLVKRRLGRARGASVPGLDQLDFVVAALLLAFAFAPEWAVDVFTLPVVVVAVVITPVLHLSANGVAYLLGLKQEPY